MKILISANSYWNLFNFRIEIIKELINLDYEIILLASFDSYKSEFRDLRVRCVDIKIDKKGTNIFKEFFLLCNYYKILYELKPDIILSYTIKPNIYGAMISKLLGFSIITNVSGLGTVFLNKSIGYLFAKYFYAKILSFSSHVFFQNPYDKILITNINSKISNISSVIPGSGVSLTKFSPKENISDISNIIFVGRLIKDKGILEFLDVVDSFSIEENSKIKFYIAGELNVENSTAISENFFQNFLSEHDNLKYLGKVDDIKKIYSKMDLLVLPSYREGLSRSILEACSSGLPVVTSDVPGCSDIIIDGVNGYLCNPRDSTSLKHSINKMLSLSKNELLNMSKKSREIVQSKFSIGLVLDKYLNQIGKLKK